jgi:Na+/proline symporter
MVAVWAVFALMVFVLEPLVVHRLFHDYALRDKERAFALAIWLHAVALTVAVVAIAAGVVLMVPNRDQAQAPPLPNRDEARVSA